MRVHHVVVRVVEHTHTALAGMAGKLQHLGHVAHDQVSVHEQLHVGAAVAIGNKVGDQQASVGAAQGAEPGGELLRHDGLQVVVQPGGIDQIERTEISVAAGQQRAHGRLKHLHPLISAQGVLAPAHLVTRLRVLVERDEGALEDRRLDQRTLQLPAVPRGRAEDACIRLAGDHVVDVGAQQGLAVRHAEPHG